VTCSVRGLGSARSHRTATSSTLAMTTMPTMPTVLPTLMTATATGKTRATTLLAMLLLLRRAALASNCSPCVKDGVANAGPAFLLEWSAQAMLMQLMRRSFRHHEQPQSRCGNTVTLVDSHARRTAARAAQRGHCTGTTTWRVERKGWPFLGAVRRMLTG
jgi:hypothetical protein